MTVNELLAKLSAAFSLFTPHAAAVWGPVYRASLGGHEGPVLAKAFHECLQAFEATPRKGYPSPKDFAAYLPSRLDLGTEGEPCIRDAMQRRRDVAPKLMAEWWASQGIKIEEARGHQVAAAARHIASDLAQTFAWKPDPPRVRLTLDQITVAEQRAASRQRVQLFGSLPRTNAQWDEETAQARTAMQGARPVRLSTTTQAAE